jgi:hypothetical protein
MDLVYSRSVFETKVFAVIEVVQAFAPVMQRRPGKFVKCQVLMGKKPPSFTTERNSSQKVKLRARPRMCESTCGNFYMLRFRLLDGQSKQHRAAVYLFK